MVSRKIYIIAEIGINHEGDVETCGRMIEAAAEAGANAVKLQTVDAEESYVVGTESYGLYVRAQLSREETTRMFALARNRNVDIFTTAGDCFTLDWVETLQPCAHKISSGLLTHVPLIRQAARYGRPMLVSTGMASVEEIDTAVEAIRDSGNEKITLLQCTSKYPTPPEALQISAIDWMRSRWSVEVGLSDHSQGDDAAFLAVGAGAVVIEKHFSFDPGRPDYDHRISVDVAGLRRVISRVRLAESMMGSAGKEISLDMSNSRKKFMRCLVARKPIVKGERFTVDNLAVKRSLPNLRGLEPVLFDNVIGKSAKRDLGRDEPVKVSDIEGSLC
jgi:sialic acid synthase SpsE